MRNVSRWPKILVLFAGLLLLLSIVGFLAMPKVVAMLPSRYRQRLPGELLRLVITPLPTALPAPAVPISQPIITIPAIIFPTPSITPTQPPPVPTSSPPTVQREVPAEPAALTSTPTAAKPTTTPTQLPSATPSPTALPLAFRIEGLKIVAQKFNNCGPSNLSINLSYYGHNAPQLVIASVVKPDEDDRNVSPEELVAYVNERTPLKARLFHGGDLRLIKRLLASGFPVVIEKGIIPSEWEGWMGHYLTLIGYDDATREFQALDTLLGPWDSSGRPVPYQTVNEQWGHFNYTFFVVYPLEQESLLKDLVGTELLSPTMMWQHAAMLAQSDIDYDAQNPYAWFNLGSSLTRLGELTERPELFFDAAAAFDQARTIGLPARMLWYQFDPYVAYLASGRIEDVIILSTATLAGGGRDVEETYLYRGHALMAQGKKPAAREAYRLALQINPGFQLAREALERSD